MDSYMFLDLLSALSTKNFWQVALGILSFVRFDLHELFNNNFISYKVFPIDCKDHHLNIMALFFCILCAKPSFIILILHRDDLYF